MNIFISLITTAAVLWYGFTGSMTAAISRLFLTAVQLIASKSFSYNEENVAMMRVFDIVAWIVVAALQFNMLTLKIFIFEMALGFAFFLMAERGGRYA